MAKQIVVHKGRVNSKTLKLNMGVTGDDLYAEIRERPDQSSPLIATWVLTAEDTTIGKFNMFLDDQEGLITAERGFMDVLLVTGGQPVSVFDEPLAVEFRGTVTVMP